MILYNKTLLCSALLLLSASTYACGSSSTTPLRGAGASFPAKIYARWFSDLAKAGGPKVNYQSIGSGSGRKAFIDETVDFGASDDPMNAKDIAKVQRGLVQIPIIGGTIAFGYNYDCDLKLTQKQAVRIAIGKIKNWKELGCAEGKLTWAHRSDGSGTTKAFTNSMKDFSNEWTLGSGKSVNWAGSNAVGAKGNAGVAGVIRNNPGTIGYLNQSYIKGKIKAASLENLSGEFLKPTVDSGAKALNGINLDSNLAGNNPNPTARGAYPITTLTWILAYKTDNGSKQQAIQKALRYLLSDAAQNKAAKLGFIPLQGNILLKSRNAIDRIGE
ncbi:phosphate ABC transporter substrate-binding protein PstS [Prochlorococcus sp. MIT 1300]|uniref:phosphate ABC transporter substrate-binding protein PstS n=1 Tax=Prochlorococcus sp. MIT 1300 TaxID=3096218 RepID=UPI002A74D6A8|nr:phosphate ABC transporter substrate-binding protein PstS [Prochlorococcus sp. MIT 1300]